MKINVTVSRSPEWVKAESIKTGENVPTEVKFEVDVTDLSNETRQRLWDYKGSYTDLDRIYFGQDRTPNKYSNYGYRDIKIDNETPTDAEIDQAILGAFAEIEQERIKWEAEQAERAEQDRQEAEIKAYREKQLASARELLKDELDELEETKGKLKLLSQFVNYIPDDACRGALKAMHAYKQNGTLSALRDAIEDSSVGYVVFDSDNDDEQVEDC